MEGVLELFVMELDNGRLIKKIADAWLHKQINVLLNFKKKKPEKSFTDFLKSYLLACVLHKIILKKIKAETLGTSSQPSLKLTETNI